LRAAQAREHRADDRFYDLLAHLAADPDFEPAMLAGLNRPGPPTQEVWVAWGWMFRLHNNRAAKAAARVLARYKRGKVTRNLTLARIPRGEGLEVRVSLWRGLVHVRTWYRRRDGKGWRPSRYGGGVTLLPEQLGQLEVAVREAREAMAASEPAAPATSERTDA
jgi:hypothetical protein